MNNDFRELLINLIMMFYGKKDKHIFFYSLYRYTILVEVKKLLKNTNKTVKYYSLHYCYN